MNVNDLIQQLQALVDQDVANGELMVFMPQQASVDHCPPELIQEARALIITGGKSFLGDSIRLTSRAVELGRKSDYAPIIVIE